LRDYPDTPVMAVCPQCGTELNVDFGMVLCTNCRAVSVIDMDGNVTLDAPPPAPESTPDVNANAPTAEPPEIDLQLGQVEPEAMPVDSAHDISAEPSDSPPPIPEEYTDILSGGYDVVQSPDTEPISSPPPISAPASAELHALDLSGFTSDIGDAKSLFTYDIVISGIDTREMRANLIESLDDPRLRLEREKIVQQINQGNVTLPAVSAVKAVVIVSRLKAMPIEIRWVQHTIYE